MTIAQNSVAKLSVAFVTVAMLFSLVAPAQAQTVEELQAQIAALMAQISSLSTTPAATTGSCTTPAAPLTMGSQGAAVTALQNLLISQGQTIAAGATGYFGGQTQAALAAWQAANGVSPAAGYYGPITKAAMDAKCVPATTPGDEDDEDTDEDTTSGELGNDEGSIKKVSGVAADESNLDEGQEGGVLAFDVEVEGDVEIDRLDVFAEVVDSTTASDNADDYFVRAFLMVDGEEVAELDVDEFDDDDYAGYVTGGTVDTEYRLRFSNLGLVFADGDEKEFQVGFEVLGSLDSDDLAGDWNVAAKELRFVDGKGFSDTEPLTETDSFGFTPEEMAELDISKSSDSRDGTTVEVDDADTSEEVEIFTFDIEEQNGVDVTINDFTMTASTTNGDVTTTIDEVKLYVGGDEVGSDSPNAAGALSFENLDLEIAADETVTVVAKVVFNGTDDYAEGDEVFLTFNAVTDARDANGNDEGDIDGASNAVDFSSDTFSLRSEGIALEHTSDTATMSTKTVSNSDVEIGTYVFKFDVMAFGKNFYIDEAANVINYELLVDGVAVAAASSSATLDIAGAADAVTSDFKIAKNDDAQLTFTVKTADSVSGGSVKVRINSVKYSVADDGSEELTENAVPASDWTSDSLILN